MPAWIHDRAKHLRRDNPSMPKSMSYALATQQSHATGHTPQGYGTAEGKREAKAKYDEPSKMKQTADPSHKSKTSSVDLARWKGFSDELQKIAASVADVARKLPKPPKPISIPREPSPPAPVTDLMRSGKTIQPPPVTAGSID